MHPETKSPRPSRTLLVYVVFVFLGGALLAPWLYWAVQTLMPGGQLAQHPFHRFLDRALLGLALVGIWPLVRSLGLNTPAQLGITRPSGQWGRMAGGVALGFGSLATVAIIALVAGARRIVPDVTIAQLGGYALAAAGTALVVAVIEEVLFRGVIFGSLRKIWKWPVALLVSSAIYAIVHFLGKTDLAGPVTWHSGLELLPRKLQNFANLEAIIPGFLNLTIAGVILGFAYQKSGNLYFSFGLHAGWIFWLKSYGKLTQSVTEPSWFWGTNKLIDGWLALIVLSLAFVVVWSFARPRRSHS